MAAVARRERDRDETRGVEIRGSGCDRRRGGRSREGGGGGEHGGLGNFSEDLRDSGRVRGGRLGDERIWSAGFRTGFFLPWEIFCASGGLVNFSWGGACVWWCTCLSRRGGRETLSETVAFSAPPVRPSLSPSSSRSSLVSLCLSLRVR